MGKMGKKRSPKVRIQIAADVIRIRDRSAQIQLNWNRWNVIKFSPNNFLMEHISELLAKCTIRTCQVKLS